MRKRPLPARLAGERGRELEQGPVRATAPASLPCPLAISISGQIEVSPGVQQDDQNSNTVAPERWGFALCNSGGQGVENGNGNKARKGRSLRA